MLKMRLQRVGRRNSPSYRVVVVDSRTGPKSNKYTDLLGSYDPKIDYVNLDGDKAKEWLSKGVKASDTVHNILVKEGVINEPKRNSLPKKTAPEPEVSEEETTESEVETSESESATENEEVESSEEETTSKADEGAEENKEDETKNQAEESDSNQEAEDSENSQDSEEETKSE